MPNPGELTHFYVCFSFSTIWISFMGAHKTDVTLWCSRTPWRKCKSSFLCKKLERSMPKLWKKWKSLAVASQMWPITTSSTGNPCGRTKTSLTGQRIYIIFWQHWIVLYHNCSFESKKGHFMMGWGPNASWLCISSSQIMTSWKISAVWPIGRAMLLILVILDALCHIRTSYMMSANHSLTNMTPPNLYP